MRRDDGRPTAEEMLERVRRQAGAGARGRHRIYLGIALGVGKTYTALEEIHRRRNRGTDAVIRRQPAVALVDEIAHTNAPGSVHEKRWQDVEDILNAGITVISTINIQHLESLADIVEI